MTPFVILLEHTTSDKVGCRGLVQLGGLDMRFSWVGLDKVDSYKS